jgi:tyrosine-protein kinase Etk/Wzc
MLNPPESVLRNPENNHTVFLMHVFMRLWKRRVLILGITAFFIALGVVYSLISPITYVSQAIIIPPVADRGYSGFSLGKDLPFDLASTLFGSGNSDKDLAERFVLMLTSDRLRIAVIDSFKLADRYGFTKKKKKYFIEDVMTAVGRKTFVYSNKGTVTISIIDKSPATSAAMVNYMIVMLDSLNKEIIKTQMGRKKEFLSQRMLENRDSLALYENMLVAFQKEHGIIDIQRQAEASVSLVAQTEVDMVLKELQLSLDEAKFSPNTVGLYERNSEIRALREKLMKIDKIKESVLLLPIKRIPDEALTFARLQRGVAVTDMLDKFITKSYEEARLEEKNNVPTIAVLDPARVPQKRFQPKRRKIVVFFMFIGLGLGLISAVLLDSLEPLRKEFPAAKA